MQRLLSCRAEQQRWWGGRQRRKLSNSGALGMHQWRPGCAHRKGVSMLLTVMDQLHHVRQWRGRALDGLVARHAGLGSIDSRAFRALASAKPLHISMLFGVSMLLSVSMLLTGLIWWQGWDAEPVARHAGRTGRGSFAWSGITSRRAVHAVSMLLGVSMLLPDCLLIFVRSKVCTHT